MKMYASVASERASKGQGGNKRLDVQLTVGSGKDPVDAGSISVREVEPDVFTIDYYQGDEGRQLARIETKGNKQEGVAVCKHLPKCEEQEEGACKDY